ncbi:low affinity iron permease family protein [Mycoplana dimorpha]|uniref:Low affinity Fe/Cu permease n=1 Tax=Mycoplana dimorpha TaxID=28320 RepID=A0A2T5AXF2_MYCDI|nr:low affinity iron permease family protein [Mycoplana dimorpha]PTM91421.1 low affinity Fe/Cu permease [Mycoplana dimorpha]
MHIFTAFSNRVAELAGRPTTFILAVAGVVIWAIAGPFFDYSENWQLVINTSTTIITFLMVFILQNTQNRDGKALQAKLDELILTSKVAENRFVGVERLEEHELRRLSQALAERAEQKAEGEHVDPLHIADTAAGVQPVPSDEPKNAAGEPKNGVRLEDH